MMTASILNTIKKLIGIADDDPHFDTDLIVHINTVLDILNQIGVSSDPNFEITGSAETWEDYLPDMSRYKMIKDYVYHRVRLMFDPPANSSAVESIKATITELEFRIFSLVEPDFQEGSDTS